MEQNEDIKSQINSSETSKENPKSFLIFIVVALLVLGLSAGVYLGTRKEQRQQTPQEQKKEQAIFNSISKHTMVFGYWDSTSSHINAVDLNSGVIQEVAVLPSDIKKVTIVSPQKLILINQTDSSDHGKEIASYDLGSKLTIPLINATSGFGIDDYVISPGKRFLATWEIIPGASKTLLGGKSRVYSIDLQNPESKNLIYDETFSQGVPVHYPVAILDNGEIFLDTFEANTTAGWANGMSISNFTGQDKKVLTSMLRGTYGTQPTLSPDGKYLAFAGYDGSLGSGIFSVAQNEGFRQAILSPNTVEILDTNTKQRIKLPKLSDLNRYPNVAWDASSGNVIYSLISKNSANNGVYLYDISKSDFKRLRSSREGEQNDYSVISTLSNNNLLSGIKDPSSSSLGNLGEKYASSFSEISVYDYALEKRTSIGVNQSLIQYLAILQNDYFKGAQEIGRVDTSKGADRDKNQLQLQTFVLKPSLEPKRIEQQTSPICRNLAAEQCNSLLGTNFDPNQRNKTTNNEYNACFDQQFKELRATQGACSDSPLYLYGQPGKEIGIKIGTDISSSNINYNGSYNVILGKKDAIISGGNQYDNISFDYVSALKRLPRLEYGKTVKSQYLSSVLQEFGKKLGLTDREINDLVVSLEGKISRPYVFVSFFDEETSKAILPISFNPAPDIYRNIVFFLKPLDDPAVSVAPQFPEVTQRQGFTAVEVSYIID